jgi:hypothetical protein
MNAKEAHARAQDRNTNITNSQYARVKTRILAHSDNGSYECWFYERLLDDVKLKLEQEGYVVGENSEDRDGSCQIHIKW